MPLPPTPSMGMVLPIENADNDVWDQLLNEALELRVDIHDHTLGLGAPIPSAALNINADVPWTSGGVPFAITSLKAVDFTPIDPATVVALQGALFCNSTDGNNLYFRTVSGTNVRIINGTALDVSLVGGIGGDYTTAGALVSYSDSADAYLFQQQGAPRPWARIQSGDVDIFQTAPSIINRVRLRSPNALAASYEFVLPPALSGSAALLQATNAGVMSHSNTLTQPLTALDLRHSASNTIVLPASLAVDVNPSHVPQTGGASGALNRYLIAASSNRLMWPVPLKNGDRIVAYGVFLDKNTSNANTVTARLFMTDGETGTESALGAGNSNSANAPNFITLGESGLSIDVDENFQYYLVFTPGGGVTPANDVVFHAIVSYSRP